MFEILKKGYEFFVMYDDEGKELVGTMKKYDGNDYETYSNEERLHEDEIMFIDGLPSIKDYLNKKIRLSVIYDDKKNCFTSSMKTKNITGEWITIVKASGVDFVSSVITLESKCSKTRNQNESKRVI